MKTLAPLLAGRIHQATQLALATFAAVPDEKLDYKPSDSARSARELMQHIVDGNGLVGPCAGAEVVAPTITDRASLAHAVEATSSAIADHVSSLEDEEFNKLVMFFGHEMPLVQVAFAAEWHISRHSGQLDYLQTIWGDMEDHR